MLPVNGALPRHVRSSGMAQDATKNRWQRCYVVSLTLFASALLATLVTFGVLNFLLNGVALPPVSSQTGLLQTVRQPEFVQQGPAAGTAQLRQAPGSNATSLGDQAEQQPAADAIEPPAVKPPPLVWHHPYDDLQGLYKLPEKDTSPRCQQSEICDGDHSCGPDKLGCVTSAEERKEAVRKAIAWAWEGYRKFAWGHDEVDVLTKSPHAWFNLGLTIVDSLDTLLIAGLMDEYHQARHWVANHLVFHDGSNVQFFEVNIRILGGLVSAYYLSGGDDLYLHKAEMLSDRLLVAFNTSSGLPVTYVPLRDAAGRAKSGMADANTNIAEAGTISMEFTSIGRLLGRDDLFDAAQQFWYVLMSSRNFSGLYCMGIHTSKADCYNPAMTIGSAADSTYEYMLKQWIMSNRTQEVPLELYKSSMKGVRKYLVRHVWDGHEESSIVSEARADPNSGNIGETTNRFEHLTCFAGGMFVLGALHGVNTEVDENDFDEAILGARIGRACYELYHQTASGLAPDSVTFKLANGQPLPPRSADFRAPGVMIKRPGHRAAPHQPTIKAEAKQPVAEHAALNDVQTPKTDATAPSTGGTVSTGDASEQQHHGRHLMAFDDGEERGRFREQEEGEHRHMHGLHEHGRPEDAPHQPQRRRMQEEGEDRRPHGHAPVDREVLLRMPHRHMHEDEEESLPHRPRRLHADDPEGRERQPNPHGEQPHSDDRGRQPHPHGEQPQSDDREHRPEDVRSAEEREAAIKAQRERFAEAQRAMAQREAEARHQEQQRERAASQAQQQQAAAAQQHHSEADKAPGSESNEKPKQQPREPPVTATTQMTAADFLRPETIETLFYLWRATGDEIYREWGWNMFRAFERWTRRETGGYATINNVNVIPPGLSNKMESFFLAETLKYFYLLFEDDPNVLPLDQWVFNTEAHPLPVWGSPADKQAMARLKQRRHAARLERKRHEAEEEAVAELEDIKEQGAALAQHAPQRGKPADRAGYGLGGVEMFRH